MVDEACDWSGVFIVLRGRSGWGGLPPTTLTFWLPLRQDGQMEDIQYLYNDGIPFGPDCAHTHRRARTHTRTTRICQRALPADEPGHFSFPWLREIHFFLMEHRHISPKLWRDNSFPILYLSLEYLRLLPGAGWQQGQRLPYAPPFHFFNNTLLDKTSCNPSLCLTCPLYPPIRLPLCVSCPAGLTVSVFVCSSCIPVPVLFLRRNPRTSPEPVQPWAAAVSEIGGDCDLTVFVKLGVPVSSWSEIFPCRCHPVISWLYLARGRLHCFSFDTKFRPLAHAFHLSTVSTLCTPRPEHFCGQLGKISWRVVMATFVCILCQRPQEAGQTFMCINVCECVLVKAWLCACEQGLCPDLLA